MFNLILFGPPGSGKGTQSEKIIERFGLKHLSTGDLLRSEIAAKTPLGLEAEKIMNRGILVPDEVVVGMISSVLETNPDASGFLFDGFPRTAAQAEALDSLLELRGESIGLMLALEVEEEELVRRILHRGKTSGRGDDNDHDIIAKRVHEYKTKTEAVADHYRKAGKVVYTNGEGSIDEIFSRVAKEIESRMETQAG